MGFNNGYDSGYSDCEAENRRRWEREAVERYKAENPPSGGSSGGTRSAKSFKLAAVDASPTVESNSDPDFYDIQIILQPPTNMDGAESVSGTWSTKDSGTPFPTLTWIPSAPTGGWVVGDVVVIGKADLNSYGGSFAFKLGDSDNSFPIDDTSWDNSNIDPSKTKLIMTYKGNDLWDIGILATTRF